MNTNLRSRYNKIASQWNGEAYKGLRRDDVIPEILKFAEFESTGSTVKVLEVMCGTGKVGCAAKEFLEKLGKDVEMTFLDFSQAMLDQVCAKPARKICSDACNIPFLSNNFDRVFTRFALHDIEREKQILVLHEVWRVLKNEGLYILIAYCTTAKTQSAYNAIVNLKDELAGNKGESDRHFPTKEEYIRLLEYAGFTSVESNFDFSGTIRYQKTAEMDESGKQWVDFVLNLPEDVKHEMGIEIQQDGTVEFQFPATIFVARK